MCFWLIVPLVLRVELVRVFVLVCLFIPLAVCLVVFIISG